MKRNLEAVERTGAKRMQQEIFRFFSSEKLTVAAVKQRRWHKIDRHEIEKPSIQMGNSIYQRQFLFFFIDLVQLVELFIYRCSAGFGRYFLNLGSGKRTRLLLCWV